MLLTAGVPPYTPVLDLRRRLKCRECRWKGRAAVSIKWATEAFVGRVALFAVRKGVLKNKLTTPKDISVIDR